MEVSRASRGRSVVADEVGGGGEGVVECTCRSCTAVAVADCVALGCCPCALVSMLTLALVKVPWAVSRRCLRAARRRMGSSCFRRRWIRRVRADEEEKRTTSSSSSARSAKSLPSEEGGGGAGGQSGEELLPVMRGAGELSDKVWIEFYQIGQWGFGRLSFSGIKAWDWGS